MRLLLTILSMGYFFLVSPVNADSKSKGDNIFSGLFIGPEFLNETEKQKLVNTLNNGDPKDLYLLGNIYQTGHAPNERKVEKI